MLCSGIPQDAKMIPGGHRRCANRTPASWLQHGQPSRPQQPAVRICGQVVAMLGGNHRELWQRYEAVSKDDVTSMAIWTELASRTADQGSNYSGSQ